MLQKIQMSTDTNTEPITTESLIDASGNTGDAGPLIDISGTPVIVPQTISLNDILSAVELIQQKEDTDKANLESIGNITFDVLRAKLVQWAKAGFPNAYEIYQVNIVPPTVCSDGTARDLTDYIVFCSGKTIQEHVAVLQEKVTDMIISFANMGSYIAIVISKPIS